VTDLSAFEERIGHTFRDRDLLTRALTHKSFSHEAKNGGVLHNETFEFLGDSVLGFVIGDLLFSHFPLLDEGALSKMKAFLVSASSLGAKARMYGMGDVILLGVGEEKTGGRKKESLLANLFEAMIAAVYLTAASTPRAISSFARSPTTSKRSTSRTCCSTTTRPRCRSSRRAAVCRCPITPSSTKSVPITTRPSSSK
jgi:dsRNA-specific ribonuclease